MASWFDPISERWHPVPEPPKPLPVAAEPEDIYAAAARHVRINNIWDAVVASATATNMHTT